MEEIARTRNEAAWVMMECEAMVRRKITRVAGDVWMN
jgi:hypothetical protein